MATVKISALPAAAPLAGTEEIPCVQTSATVKTTAQDIANLAPAGPSLPLSIANGGTGETTAQAALDALFAAVSKGSIWVGDGTNVTPVAVGADGDIIFADSTQTNGVRWGSPSGLSLAIGQSISGSTFSDVLFVGVGKRLAESSDLQFNGTVSGLSVITAAGAQGSLTANDGTINVQLCGSDGINIGGSGNVVKIMQGGTGGIHFVLGPNNYDLFNGGVGVSYTAGTSGNWTGSPPVDVWLALDRLAQYLVTNFPLNPPP